MQTDRHLNWKDHIEELVPKLSAACYAVRLTVHISNISTLKSVYFAYCYSEILWVTVPTVGRYSLYKIKLAPLWLVQI